MSSKHPSGITSSSARAEPTHPSNENARELTVRTIIIGLVLSVVMGAANVYLGLYAGLTVSASIPSAVLGILLLRGLFRSGSLLEANQIQTTASAGESLAAGIIFTVPALVLVGAWQRFDFFTTTAIAFTGGLLGVFWMVPMRRVFVVDNPELPYPEGVACATVLRAVAHSDASADAGRQVLWGGLAGAVFKALVSFLGVLKGTLEGAFAVAPGRVLFFGADISPALLGVGYIVGLRVALTIFAGGALAWFLFIPLLPDIERMLSFIAPHFAGAPDPPQSKDALAYAWLLWSSKVRYIGVGAMVVGGVMSIVRIRHGLLRAIEELRRKRTAAEEADPAERDLSARTIGICSIALVLMIAGIYYGFTKDVGVTALATVLMVIASFFFVAVASYIVGLVGNSNSPVSGMTITAVLFAGGILYVAGFTGMRGVIATLGVAAIVCCAACTSGDTSNDLKTGSMVGASPWKQQVMQIAGVAVASFVMAPVLQLLDDTYRIGSPSLSAPQASLFASLTQGLFGEGELPWGLVCVGVVLGVVVVVLDAILEHRRSSVRLHLMPIAIGMYLPFGLSVPILIGGVIAHIVAVRSGRRSDEHETVDRGVLFASGIIAGESLFGIFIALVAASFGVTTLGWNVPFSGVLTFGSAVAMVVWFFMMARARKTNVSPRT